MIAIGHCPLAMKRNLTKHVCVAVYELLTALLTLELALPEEEIPKHVHSTQYQFEVFKNVNCFMSLCRCHLDKTRTLLFRNSTMQKEKEGCCLFIPPALETCGDSL